MRQRGGSFRAFKQYGDNHGAISVNLGSYADAVRHTRADTDFNDDIDSDEDNDD